MIKFLIVLISLITFNVNAQTYTPSQNYTGGTQEQYLVNIAKNRIDNFETMKFIIFQDNQDYYLIAFKDYTISGTQLKMQNTKIIRYYRTGTTGSNYYNYTITSETSSTFNMSYLYLTNLNSDKGLASEKVEEFNFKQAVIGIIMLILAFKIVSTLTKERTHV